MYHSTYCSATSFSSSQMGLFVYAKNLYVTKNPIPAKGTGRMDLISYILLHEFFKLKSMFHILPFLSKTSLNKKHFWCLLNIQKVCAFEFLSCHFHKMYFLSINQTLSRSCESSPSHMPQKVISPQCSWWDVKYSGITKNDQKSNTLKIYQSWSLFAVILFVFCPTHNL